MVKSGKSTKEYRCLNLKKEVWSSSVLFAGVTGEGDSSIFCVFNWKVCRNDSLVETMMEVSSSSCN